MHDVFSASISFSSLFAVAHKSVGINPRFDIPFEGDMHNALSDARHQVKYVSAIWQHLTKN
ncbi:3'-5' exoribonuclease domain-containing protein [Citrobacter portucalensis]|uniref:3'-5' exoribonuclease domain-containing protein n=1 Tax=Citrobacter portucalensis TaxID=1639133 RepID=UPI001A32A798|nr:3'-5' exoribonuclease [Citrobacter portucalensis]